MYRIVALLFSTLILMSAGKCTNNETGEKSNKVTSVKNQNLDDNAVAVFASGCFWCVEAIFESVEGVAEVISGYSGGSAQDANYQDVSAGITDHAEAVEIYYDPSIVSYETLLKVFFGSHDPTTLNQQGPDRGRQYRSAIFYKNEEEKKLAEAYVAQLLEEGTFEIITTEIVPLVEFYDAEDYHQDFERRNPKQSYVRAVSIPRLKRFQKKFPELLKKGAH